MAQETDEPTAPRAGPTRLRAARPYELPIGGVLGRGAGIWLRNFVPFTLLAILVSAPVFCALALLARALGRPFDESTLDLITNGTTTASGTLLSGGLAYTVFQQLRGRPVSMADTFAVGLRRLLPVLGVGILAFLLIFLGALACLIPGIIVQCTLFVSTPVCVVERPGILASMKRSASLTRGNRLPIFALTVVLNVLSLGGVLLLGLVLGALAAPSTVLYVVTGLAAVLTTGLIAVMQSVTYHDLRLGKEGADVDELVAVFE